MNCDQALAALATGGPLRRRLAARHLARCPSCEGRAEALRRIVGALSDVPPLTDLDRQSWMKAADESRHEPDLPTGPRAPILRRLAIAASILGLGGLGTWLANRPASRVVVAEVDPVVVKRATLRDLDGLQADASSLSKELDDLLKEVDLLDARRDVEALQLQFASLDGRRESP